MSSPAFVLKTKLLPPRTVPEILHRARLFEKLNSNQNSPVTIAAADAGCGKTTLISEFVKAQSKPSVWYQLDHSDADPVVFLNYLTTGISQLKPEFGAKIFAYLADAGEDLAHFPDRAVDLLINEILDQIEEQFIIVLDDYHHIGRDTVVHRIVDRFVQYSADLFHLMITTRDIPPLAIAKRKTQFRSMMITREDLLFTDDEVRQLFKATLNIELSDNEVEEYRKRTQGWVTALQLIRQVAERELASGGEVPSFDYKNVLKGSELDIFDYFAEEVFARESPETEDAFMRLSVVESMPLNDCIRLFPDLHCSAILPELAQRNVFLSVAGDGAESEVYRFHPLFRDFLQRRFRSEKGNAAILGERKRVADLYLKDGGWDQAIPLLIDAEETELAAEILAEHGTKWIAAGTFTSVSKNAERIADESLDQFPRSLLHMAEAERLQGQLDNAKRLLERAVRCLAAIGDKEGQAEALHSLASLSRRKGELDKALTLLASAESLADHGSEAGMRCANTRGLCLVSDGNWVAAEQQFRVALEIAETKGNEQFVRVVAHNLALAPGLRGDFAEALRWFRRIFGDGKPEKLLPQEAIGHLNVARLHLYRGELQETEDHLGRSLHLCQLFNLRALRGEIFEAFANLYRERKELPRAEEFYRRAEADYSDAGINPISKEFFEEFAKYYRLIGDRVRSRTLLERLIEHRKEKNNEHGIHSAKLGICRLDLDEGRVAGLVGGITEHADFFKQRGSNFDEALAMMLLAEAHFVSGDLKAMSAAVARVLDLSARFDYDYWLRNEIEQNRDIFAYEDIFERLPLDLRAQVSAEPKDTRSVEAPPVSTISTQSFRDLSVELLGHVRIFRDQQNPLSADAWTTKRARDIFCFIASSKNRRVAKDVLMDLFWADEDLRTIEKNFHPTISHIRKALNAGRTMKQNFLLFRDGAYQLNTDVRFLIDTEEFDESIAAAEKAKKEKDSEMLRDALERASKLYRGEFMEGCYDDWAEERRGYYREQNLRVLSALAKLAFSEKKWTQVQRLSEQIFADDPFREDIHRLVLRTLAAQGKAAAAKKHFETLRSSLRSELDIEPSPETRRIFKELVD